MSELPPLTVTTHEGFDVVRDDLLLGGTKRRALPRLMAEEWPEREFVFGGPAYGYAQVALAYSAADVGKRSTYFVAKRKELHPLTRQAGEAGCRIVEVPAGRLSVVQHRAKLYAKQAGARFLPLGFDLPEFRAELTAVALKVPILFQPDEVWCAAGSGALSRALQDAWPYAEHNAVQIGFAPDVGKAKLWTAPEAFSEPARFLPPFPSAVCYDAKVWGFLVDHGSPGALFWNVGA